MSWGMVGAAGVSIVGGMMGSSSAKKGARAQARAIREATDLQRRMYDTNRADLAGYRDLGTTGLNQINAEFGDLTRSFTASDFVKDPGYDFRMKEGAKALERSASARGGLMGGAAGKAMARYGQDYASNEYNNVYNRFNNDRDQRLNKLMGFVNVGQNSATQTGAAAQNFANQAGQNIIGGGNAQAASAIAGGNAWQNAIEQGIGAYTAFGNNNNNNTQSIKPVTWAENFQPMNASQMIKDTRSPSDWMKA